MDMLDLIEEFLVDKDEAMRKLLTFFMNLVLEFEAEQQTGVSRYQRSESRTAFRNGKRTRGLKTRYGDIELEKPELRGKIFQTTVFDRYSRVERALECAIIESYIQGVSTRRIRSVVEALGVKGISADTVSRMSRSLDEEVQKFLCRPIELPIPYLIIDAVYLKTRDECRYVSKAVLIISGVRSDGIREILGMSVATSENEQYWRSLFEELKERGLTGVQLVISDGHLGIQKAVLEGFPNSSWQMCLVHFQRAIMRSIPQKYQEYFQKMLSSALFEDPGDLQEVTELLLEKGYLNAVSTIERFLPDIRNYRSFPVEHWKRIRTTNMMERVNKEIKRRYRVIGSFPNQNSLIRLVGSILMDINEEWVTGNKYLDMGLLSQIEMSSYSVDQVTQSIEKPLYA